MELTSVRYSRGIAESDPRAPWRSEMQLSAREEPVGAKPLQPEAVALVRRHSNLITFFKYIRSSNGHEFKCVQEIIAIERAKSLDRAVEAAKRRFERRRHVPDWQLHADGFDVKINGC
jgi:hypothetical protein